MPLRGRSWRKSTHYEPAFRSQTKSLQSRLQLQITIRISTSLLIKSPIIYDARLTPIDIAVSTGTKDLQTVTISLRILQQPIP